MHKTLLLLVCYLDQLPCGRFCEAQEKGLPALQKADPPRSEWLCLPRSTLHIKGELPGICSVCCMCTSHGLVSLMGTAIMNPLKTSGAGEGAEVGEVAAIGPQQLGHQVFEGARDFLKGGALLRAF